VSPELIGLNYESVTLTTSDGKHIAGWWFPKRQGPDKPILLILHGFGAAKEHMINHVLLAQKNGFPAMVIDFRGHGDSDPALASFGYHERKDVVAALDFLKARGEKRVCLWGISMGAVTALMTAALHPENVCGVIADAPFDTLHNTIAHHARLFYGLPEFPLLYLTYPRIEARGGYPINAVSSIAALREIHVPVFFMAGEKDLRMPVALVRSLYEQARAPKRFYVIPKAGHESRPFEPEYQKEILDFAGNLKPIPVNPPPLVP